jgi:PadR family transcriptional regulator, regulatory protein AphA
MSLRHALLGLLAQGPRSGYGLLKHFEGSVGYAWPALHSQIYPELARLREQGLIEQVGEGPRGAKTYELTGRGLDEVRRWLRTEPDRTVRNEAGLRIFFLWLLPDEEQARFLERELDYQRGLLSELRAIAEDEATPHTPKERAYRLALEAGLRTTHARIEWAKWAIREVRRRR